MRFLLCRRRPLVWSRDWFLWLTITALGACCLVPLASAGQISTPFSSALSSSSSCAVVASRFALAVGQRVENELTTRRRSHLWRQQQRSATRVASGSSKNDEAPILSSTCRQAQDQQHGRRCRRRLLVTFRRPPRGGSTTTPVKTMTARQMEAFNLFSGGIAGTVASTITNPLEVIKTQLQSSNSLSSGGGPLRVARTLLLTNGVAGLFRGLPATLVGIIPARSVYFYAYQRSKKALNPYVSEGSPPNALIAGFLAGICGNTITNPIWMVRTRMQLLADAASGQVAYAGYGDAIRTIFQTEGIAGFYKGVAASYWGCTEGAAQFLMYEQLKKRLLRRRNQYLQRQGLPPTNHLSEWTLFCSAALSKMVASIATYPHEVARTRLREQAKSGIFRYKGMWGTIRIIAQEEGRRGLYSGMGVHLLKVVPNSAFMFLTYELVRKWLGEFQIED